MIRILFIEDSRAERELITTQLNLSPGFFRCQAAAGWVEALALLDAGLAPDLDLVLLDIGLPGVDGITAAHTLKKMWPHLKIVMFTGDDREETIQRALQAGADGYLLKDSTREQLSAALVKVSYGDAAFSKAVVNRLRAHFRKMKTLCEPLSPSENEILQRRERGQSYKLVADEMRISIPTLKTHQERIRVKTLGAKTIAEAAYLRHQAA